MAHLAVNEMEKISMRDAHLRSHRQQIPKYWFYGFVKAFFMNAHARVFQMELKSDFVEQKKSMANEAANSEIHNVGVLPLFLLVQKFGRFINRDCTYGEFANTQTQQP